MYEELVFTGFTVKCICITQLDVRLTCQMNKYSKPLLTKSYLEYRVLIFGRTYVEKSAYLMTIWDAYHQLSTNSDRLSMSYLRKIFSLLKSNI